MCGDASTSVSGWMIIMASRSTAPRPRGSGPEIEDERRLVNRALWVRRTGTLGATCPNDTAMEPRVRAILALGTNSEWGAAFETLSSLGPPADEEYVIDSTIVRAPTRSR
jgi:hypothetical protein